VAAGSAVGAALLAKHRRDSAEASRTILVVREASSEPGDMLARSEAVAAVLTELAPPWPLVAGVLRRIPLPVRDTGYRIVARLRYRLLGPESCRIPSAGDPRSLP
jgi:predicted DCC family thiol-disulfide oxidoreductase YuxK